MTIFTTPTKAKPNSTEASTTAPSPAKPSDIDNALFLMLCIKTATSAPKFDFDAVAATLGLKKHSAYCRYNALMKKYEGSMDDSSAKSKTSDTTPKKNGQKAAGGKRKRKDAGTSGSEAEEEGQRDAKGFKLEEEV